VEITVSGYTADTFQESQMQLFILSAQSMLGPPILIISVQPSACPGGPCVSVLMSTGGRVFSDSELASLAAFLQLNGLPFTTGVRSAGLAQAQPSAPAASSGGSAGSTAAVVVGCCCALAGMALLGAVVFSEQRRRKQRRKHLRDVTL
jgi:uncharacterized iron-regulated membrane protein